MLGEEENTGFCFIHHGSMTISGFANNKVDNAGGTAGTSKEAKGANVVAFILSFVSNKLKAPP